ncbi:hypothetical protein NRK67_13815 [Fusobacteria bacterium ZRK30]|nr:hypothetical protein NRK67_13815 [Fusobacteria bacterium ZRK30]
MIKKVLLGDLGAAKTEANEIRRAANEHKILADIALARGLLTRYDYDKTIGMVETILRNCKNGYLKEIQSKAVLEFIDELNRGNNKIKKSFNKIIKKNLLNIFHYLR